MMKRNACRVSSKKLLQLSRLDSHREKMNFKELEVGKILEDCVKKITPDSSGERSRP